MYAWNVRAGRECAPSLWSRRKYFEYREGDTANGGGCGMVKVVQGMALREGAIALVPATGIGCTDSAVLLSPQSHSPAELCIVGSKGYNVSSSGDVVLGNT